LKKKFIKISRVIELLKKRNTELYFSEKEVLKKTIILKDNSNTKNSNVDAVLEDSDSPASKQKNHETSCIINQRKYEYHVNIYYYSEKIINAKPFNNDDDTRHYIGYIKFSGHINLENKYIQNLLDNNKAMINSFSPPSQQERNIRKVFDDYDEKNGLDWSQVTSCEIDEKDRPIIQHDDIKNLVIYRTDVAKLVKQYKKVIAIKSNNLLDTGIQVTEKIPDKKIRKFMLKNYKDAAAKCLAHLLWKHYPDVLPKDLCNFWGFHTIHSYKFQTCSDNYLIIEFEKGTSEDDVRLNPCYDTTKKWINASCPEHLKIKGCPGKRNIKSAQCFRQLQNDLNQSTHSFLDKIIRSIENYNEHPTRSKFEGQLDLADIVVKIKAQSPELKDVKFWNTFFQNAGLTL